MKNKNIIYKYVANGYAVLDKKGKCLWGGLYLNEDSMKIVKSYNFKNNEKVVMAKWNVILDEIGDEVKL
jgi:hypothetical protein